MPDRSNPNPQACGTPEQTGFRTAGADILKVEQVAARHPGVEECAVIGIEDCFGSWELKAFVRPRRCLSPADVIDWCALRLPVWQVPRFVAMVDRFDRTPEQEISKEGLPWSRSNSFDLDPERRWRSLLSDLPLF